MNDKLFCKISVILPFLGAIFNNFQKSLKYALSATFDVVKMYTLWKDLTVLLLGGY